MVDTRRDPLAEACPPRDPDNLTVEQLTERLRAAIQREHYMELAHQLYQAQMDNGTTSGADLIAAERQRQIDAEGWTPEHDAGHRGEHLALAAACYALPGAHRRPAVFNSRVPRWWPWGERDWKPTPNDRVRELVKAGALIAAEIDRLQALP